jgi:AcrR family transcriptional regulator
MPPKPKVSKENSIDAALNLIRGGGVAALNARAIANELKCSTQPIFRVYATMEEVKADVIATVQEYYTKFFDEYMSRRDVPPYKASGLAYIQFAKDEKELFKILFMRDRTNEQTQDGEHSFDVAVKLIMKGTGLDYETAKKFHIEMWVFVHGIATMIATSYLDLGEAFISDILSDAYLGIIQLYKQNEKGG